LNLQNVIRLGVYMYDALTEAWCEHKVKLLLESSKVHCTRWVIVFWVDCKGVHVKDSVGCSRVILERLKTPHEKGCTKVVRDDFGPVEHESHGPK